jgi:hypothetical protein
VQSTQWFHTNVKDQRTYVVEMPAPVKDLAEWKRLHAAPAQTDPEADSDWRQRLARIVDNTSKDRQQ